ncbi:hypothetical protein [Pseudonocardia sp. EC080610-09]|nr:hypothetical protein [Pseudonocardia sp. EC080610-09]
MDLLTTVARPGLVPAPDAGAGPLTRRRVIDHGTVHSAGCPLR